MYANTGECFGHAQRGVVAINNVRLFTVFVAALIVSSAFAFSSVAAVEQSGFSKWLSKTTQFWLGVGGFGGAGSSVTGYQVSSGGGGGGEGAKLPPCGSFGDVNGDGGVSKSDASLVSDYIVGNAKLTDSQLKRADVTADGKVSAADSLYISQYLENLRTTFPACTNAPAPVPVNTAPKIIAEPKIPTSIEPGQKVEFSWSATDADGDGLAWSVSWGDNTAEVQPCPVSPNTGWTYTTSHTWSKSQTYAVQASVSDCKGGSDSRYYTIVVGLPSLAPDLVIYEKEIRVSPLSPVAGSEVVFAVTVRNVGNFDTKDYRFSYEFGDEDVGAGVVYPLSIPAGGTKIETLKHIYNTAGTYTAVFSAGTTGDVNPYNNKASKQVTIGVATVQNAAPVITSEPEIPPTIKPGQKVEFSWGAEDADGDGLAWSVGWGDNSGEASACPVPDNQGWSRSTSHWWSKAGTYTLTVEVYDCKGGSDSASYTIKVAPSPPCGEYGDVDGDGFVTEADSKLVSEHLVGSKLLTEPQRKRADVDGNSVVRLADALFIAQYAVGTRTTFPVCPVETEPVPPTPAPPPPVVVPKGLEIVPSGSTQLYFKFGDDLGNLAMVPVAYANEGDIKVGDNDDDLVLDKSKSISKSDYLVLSADSSIKLGYKSYALRYISALASTETKPKLEFRDLGTGSSIYVPYNAQPGEPFVGAPDAVINIGGAAFNVWNASLDTNINFDLKIHLMNKDGIIYPLGRKFAVAYSGSNQLYLTFADGSGNHARIPFAYSDSGVKLGDNDDDLILDKAKVISRNDYLILGSSYDPLSNLTTQLSQWSYALRYISALGSGETDPKLEFSFVGFPVDIPYSAHPGEPFVGAPDARIIRFGKVIYNVWNASADTSSNFNIQIDLVGQPAFYAPPGPVPTLPSEPAPPPEELPVTAQVRTTTVSDVLYEGETKTYMIGGKDYVTTLDFVGPTIAKFTINDEVTDSLQEGDSYTLQDGVKIALDELVGIGDDELANGIFSNTKGDFEYKQILYKFTTDGKTRYSLEFITPAESDITDNSGNANPDGTYLWNFERTSIRILGDDYSIVKARRINGDGIELALMGGAVRDVLNENETKTYVVDGKDYVTTLDFVGPTIAKFTINDEVTDSLQEGNIQTLKDGTQIGIRDIILQEFAGGVRKVEFYLGAKKFVLKDVNVNDKVSSNNLIVGEITLRDSPVIITGSYDNTVFKIETIQLVLKDFAGIVVKGAKFTLSLPSSSQKPAQVQPVQPEDVLVVVARLDSLKVSFDKMKNRMEAVSGYYSSTGDSQKAQKYKAISASLESLIGRIESSIKRISAGIDTITKEEMRDEVSGIRSYIREIVKAISVE